MSSSSSTTTHMDQVVPVVSDTLQTIAASKLLNYVQKDALVAFLTPRRYTEVEQQLKTSLNKIRITLRDVKKFLTTRDDFVDALRKSATGVDAFKKYLVAVERLRSLDKTQAAAVRRTMTQPTRRYKGCLATRLQPDDYAFCLDNYDSVDYDGIGLVPSGLRQRVHDNGNEPTQAVLSVSLARKTNTFSDLPSGLRQYISHHPNQFKAYYEQRRHEVGLMKAVLRNLSRADKQKLQAYYDQNKRIEPEKFSQIVASSSSSSLGKRPRVDREPTSTTKGGGRFDLQQRVRDAEAEALRESDAYFVSVSDTASQLSDLSMAPSTRSDQSMRSVLQE